MHLKNIYFVNLWLVFCLLFTTACNDDDNIYFTQDEIIGDINSGKQIALENNTLVVYTNNIGTSVNVQEQKGRSTQLRQTKTSCSSQVATKARLLFWSKL